MNIKLFSQSLSISLILNLISSSFNCHLTKIRLVLRYFINLKLNKHIYICWRNTKKYCLTKYFIVFIRLQIIHRKFMFLNKII